MAGDRMRLLPLILHAAARIPALTELFSDLLTVSSMTVTQGDKVTFTLPQPHGVPLNATTALCVVDADTPNAITAVTINPDRTLTITVLFEHDLSTSPSSLNGWNLTAKLAGFTNPVLNGPLQLVGIAGPNQITVLPSQEITTLTLTGAEVLLERLEDKIIGWHKVTSTGPTTFAFDTPDDITRSYTVANPKVVNNIRVAGALSLDVAQQQYTRGYKTGIGAEFAGELQKAWMFICPPQVARLSRDRNSRSDAVAEMTSGSEYRQLLIDGFFVFVFLPAENSGSGVSVSDQAHGAILSAVLRTFHGLSLPRRELFQGDAFVCYLTEHGNMLGSYDRATYVHGYNFEAPAYLLQHDAIQPFEWSQINETTMTAASGIGPGTPGGGVLPIDPTPTGTVAFRGVVLGPATSDDGTRAGGIQIDDAPGSLTAIVPLT
jgi:hypothetical protein